MHNKGHHWGYEEEQMANAITDIVLCTSGTSCLYTKKEHLKAIESSELNIERCTYTQGDTKAPQSSTSRDGTTGI